LTEAVTLIATSSVSDEIYDEVSRYFTPDEIANLLMAIVTINSWNRIITTGQFRVPAAAIIAGQKNYS